MLDNLSDRFAFILECNHMKKATDTVDADKKMTAVNLTEICTDLFFKGGWVADVT
jgi:hypothetical protein